MSWMKRLLKDLLYTRDNVSLDIARLCSFLSIVGFWASIFWSLWTGAAFDPIAAGTGCAAIMAGSAGWIHFRMRHEAGARSQPGPTDV